MCCSTRGPARLQRRVNFCCGIPILDGHEALLSLFKDWERWSAQLLESHLSYPVLAYFRSQHDNQSWISALTAILDACALTISGVEDVCARQAQLTFAIARHAVADLCQVFSAAPVAPPEDRLPAETLRMIRETLAQHGTTLISTPRVPKKNSPSSAKSTSRMFMRLRSASCTPCRRGFRHKKRRTTGRQQPGRRPWKRRKRQGRHCIHDDHF